MVDSGGAVFKKMKYIEYDHESELKLIRAFVVGIIVSIGAIVFIFWVAVRIIQII